MPNRSPIQRKLARQEKFGKNWLKTKARIAKLLQHQARIRRDFLEKLSSKWAKEHPTVIMEDLKTKNMTRSAKGTLEQPGKNVAAKRGVNRSILDQGWGMLAEMLGYKLDRRDGYLLLVPAHHSSQECSECTHVAKENRPNREVFRCQACGHAEHADVNAAKVIKKRGLAAKGKCRRTMRPTPTCRNQSPSLVFALFHSFSPFFVDGDD